ncbi:MAG TPA: N-acetyltransferase [bacterium]|mgnify:CR=1 FL=1|nr:N-acetyltransferase [bacterium]HOL48976.1 N-acetyltransferase [bacterium]HPO51346.1 N-acetyltransferase [bacterium]HXK44338.1 N-acetyltransferase [bacterium]
MKINIRPAVIDDAYSIKNLINMHAKKGKMLPVSINQIFENLRNFWVLCDSKGKILGCACLKIVWKDLGEIRSLAIKNSKQKKGYGSVLIETLMKEAEKIGIRKIFVLTYVPEFFEKFGFVRIEKTKLPHKIWIDCINCPKFPRCDEIPMLKKL